ncbi:MAG: VOC family protein [Gammaproteobacteria bacterium]|nr:VOC family protein [Gammaproteobacteria bacterium]
MHKSRLGTVILDCQTDDLGREADFWSAALGASIETRDGEDRYIRLKSRPEDTQVLLQKVDHPSWVHIDIETDNIEAEVKRLESLGAEIVEVMERWTIMQAPSKHRFCIIGPIRQGFEENATEWV